MNNVTGAEMAQYKGFAPGLDPADAEAMADEVGARFTAAREAIAKFIFGQKTVVDQVLITLLAGGNGLLIGVPGLAKTRLVDTLGTVLALGVARLFQANFVRLDTYEPAAFAGGGLLVLLSCLVASYLPSRRAGKADPMEALRAE